MALLPLEMIEPFRHVLLASRFSRWEQPTHVLAVPS